MSKQEIKERIIKAFDRYLQAGTKGLDLVKDEVAAGKLYEAFVLSEVAKHLAVRENFTLILSAGSEIVLKGSPGPINPEYPYIELWKDEEHQANMWTDVEFTALSCVAGGRGPFDPGDYHELDILIVDVDAAARPTPRQIWLGVECKHRKYTKSMLREILGVRRELSCLVDATPTRFRKWPQSTVPAEPASSLVVFASNPNVREFASPGDTFGIRFEHLPMI